MAKLKCGSSHQREADCESGPTATTAGQQRYTKTDSVGGTLKQAVFLCEAFCSTGFVGVVVCLFSACGGMRQPFASFVHSGRHQKRNVETRFVFCFCGWATQFMPGLLDGIAHYQGSFPKDTVGVPPHRFLQMACILVLCPFKTRSMSTTHWWLGT